MLVAVDVGNTQVVFGLFEDNRLLCRWRLRTDPNMTEDELFVYMTGLFASEGKTLDSVADTVISCVVPQLVQPLTRLCEKYVANAPIWADKLINGHQMSTGFSKYKSIGTDRCVNAIAAYHRYCANLIVVDFGTATTFDYIAESGQYLGGAISPGLMVSAEGLFESARGLPRVTITQAPDRVICMDTVNGLNAGIVLGHAGLVDGLVDRIQKEAGAPKAVVVATGGLAGLVSKASKTINHVEPDLTLIGLHLLYTIMKDNGRK